MLDIISESKLRRMLGAARRKGDVVQVALLNRAIDEIETRRQWKRQRRKG